MAQGRGEVGTGEGQGGRDGVGHGRGGRGKALGQASEQGRAEGGGGGFVVEQAERPAARCQPPGIVGKRAIQQLVDQLGLFHGPAELAGASSLELGPIQPGLDLGRRPVARRQHLDHGGRSLDLAQGHGDLVREGDAGFKAHDRLRKRRLREG